MTCGMVGMGMCGMYCVSEYSCVASASLVCAHSMLKALSGQ